MRKRLDIILVERGFAKSRERAKGLILSGGVLKDGKPLLKPSLTIEEDDELTVAEDPLKFVGRGGLKLQKAKEAFFLDFEGKTCLDIGASTGGFTECMLLGGALKVYAIDVGHGQLDSSLAANPKVVNMEETDARTLSKERFSEEIGFISADVSFISLKMILPKINELLSPDGEFTVLVKPQFEAGRADLNKKGIVKSPKAHIRVLNEISGVCMELGLIIKGLTWSPVCGGDGNIEYLLHGAKQGASAVIDINETVTEAFSRLSGGKER